MFEISLTTDDREVIKGFLPFPFHFRCADDTSCTGSERKKKSIVLWVNGSRNQANDSIYVGFPVLRPKPSRSSWWVCPTDLLQPNVFFTPAGGERSKVVVCKGGLKAGRKLDYSRIQWRQLHVSMIILFKGRWKILQYSDLARGLDRRIVQEAGMVTSALGWLLAQSWWDNKKWSRVWQTGQLKVSLAVLTIRQKSAFWKVLV